MATPIEHAVLHVKKQWFEAAINLDDQRTLVHHLENLVGTLVEAINRVDDTITLYQSHTLTDKERAMLEDIETEICMALYEEESR